MDTETALKINSAACGVWLFREGVVEFLSTEHLRVIRESSIAQIETAAEVTEAVNANAIGQDGFITVRCSVDVRAIPGVKKYADGMNFQ